MILHVSQMVFPWTESQVSDMPRHGIPIAVEGCFAHTSYIFFFALVWNFFESRADGESLVYAVSWRK